MFLTEHEGKSLLSRSGLAVPGGRLVHSAAEAASAAKDLGVPVVVKLQVPEGGRGKRGLVRMASGPDEAAAAYRDVTAASAESSSNRAVLVEERLEVAHELYTAVRIDPPRTRYQLIFSRYGGMEVESAADGGEDRVVTVDYDPWIGLRRYHAIQALSRSGFKSDSIEHVLAALIQLHKAMVNEDCELIEVNPLAVLADGSVAALDAKVIVDDNALGRHPWAAELGDEHRTSSVGAEMARRGLQYIELNGRVAVISPGAGLNMALIDWLADHGVTAKCFLDITGAGVADWHKLFAGEFPVAFAEALEYAFRHLVAEGVRLFLVNVTSGGSPVDGRLRGILHAIEQLDCDECRFVIHVAGNRQEPAREILRQAGWPVHLSLGEAVDAVVALDRS